MIWYRPVAVLTCFVVCESAFQHLKQVKQEKIKKPPLDYNSLTYSDLNLLEYEDYEDQNKSIREQIKKQHHINSKLQSIILQHLKPGSTAMDNLKARNKRANNEIPSHLLARNPNLQSDIDDIFGTQSNSIQPKQTNNNQPNNQGLPYDPELQENIEKTLLELEPKDKEINEENSNIPNDRVNPRLQANQNNLHEKDVQSTDNYTANTPKPRKLNALILHYFGPEIVTDNTNKKNENAANSTYSTASNNTEEHSKIHEKEDGTNNNSQVKETNIIVQTVMCLLVLLNI